MVRTGTEDRRGTQRRDRDRRVVVLPLGQQPLDLRGVDRRTEAGVRAQRRVFGQWKRVRRPRAVHRGRRESDDLAHTDRGSRVEHAARSLDVHARHQRLIRDRVDDGREVHEHVDPLEQRLEIVTGDVDPVQLEVWRPARRFAHIEPDDPRHVRLGLQAEQQTLPEEACDAGDGDGSRAHGSP